MSRQYVFQLLKEGDGRGCLKPCQRNSRGHYQSISLDNGEIWLVIREDLKRHLLFERLLIGWCHFSIIFSAYLRMNLGRSMPKSRLASSIVASCFVHQSDEQRYRKLTNISPIAFLSD